ncbi:Hypothetical_protein [Hexamita inflata]|uniref:Hypothetical_protein n=1 Tax=Hexamita inflata TaxID=28002 RepID=A0AA86PB09_9EUKA|nr:Hypothetical protein HINF_LOCUS22828 [Hexamita inflata]
MSVDQLVVNQQKPSQLLQCTQHSILQMESTYIYDKLIGTVLSNYYSILSAITSIISQFNYFQNHNREQQYLCQINDSFKMINCRNLTNELGGHICQFRRECVMPPRYK